jgi:ssDNA-binding Zn-finger/Zn-ribbon topoisomerase 1
MKKKQSLKCPQHDVPLERIAAQQNEKKQFFMEKLICPKCNYIIKFGY